ncbi:MAG: DUF2339 domain-containing protein [Treponema sp.]|jgi:uncharacterized membrane protein|nr:DUF2339 domain-containing protein [Treponema sp.]
MEGIVFLIVTAFLFSVIGVIALVVKTSRQGNLLREYGERLDRVEWALQETRNPPAGRPAVMPAVERTWAAPEESPAEAAWVEAVEPPIPPETPVEAVEPAAVPPEMPAEAARTETPWKLPAFIREGNLWAAGGLLLLLAGFATLVTYLGRRGFFTVEMGIAAAALCGFAMLILGWRFRTKRPVYFLLLQGGGIGILYFSVYAAHKLLPYFPPRLGLVVMSLLISPAIALALLQNSQVLALAGFCGGFAAPLLMAWGRGNQVFLFAYYLVLDLGVLGIGFFRRWKPLYLLALLCSFILANVWTLRYYEPELFWSAEPFFLAYILIFTVLTLRGFGGPRGDGESLREKAVPVLDGALILGTPILGALLQWKVFEGTPHGHALICLVFSAFYIALALVLRKPVETGKRILSEAYLSFGVLLANLAVPLELSPRVTSAVWAAEGLVVFVSGRRLKKTRIAALVLHAAGAIAFFFEAELWVYRGILSAGFTGSLIIAFSALAMVYFAGHSPPRPRPAFSITLTIWAFIWWFGGWAYEFYQGPADDPAALLFLICSLTALAAYGASKLLKVPAFRLGMIPSLAGGFFAVFVPFVLRSPAYLPGMLTYNYFRGLYVWAWLAFFAVQGLLIVLSRREVREDIHGLLILIAACVSLVVLSSSGRSLTVSRNLSPAWTSLAGLLPVFTAMAGIIVLARSLGPPGEREGRRRLVLHILPVILCCVLGLWFLTNLFLAGVPAPLPFYVPILNLLDLEELCCIVLFLLWQFVLMKRRDLPVLKTAALIAIADSAVFLYIIAAAARAVHFYGRIPYWELVRSDIFHLCLFILWAVYGLGHIILGNRLSQRRLWIAGAVLMIVDTAKFLLLDQAKAGAAVRIVSFFLAGLLFLFIGWAAPLPPSPKAPVEEDRAG